MSQTGSYVSLSRSKLGPDPDVLHALARVERTADRRFVARCECGRVSKARRTRHAAHLWLTAHLGSQAS